MVAWPWAAPRRRPWRGVRVAPKEVMSGDNAGVIFHNLWTLTDIGSCCLFSPRIAEGSPSPGPEIEITTTTYHLRSQDENVYASLTSVTAQPAARLRLESTSSGGEVTALGRT